MDFQCRRGTASHARNLRCSGAGDGPKIRPSSVIPGPGGYPLTEEGREITVRKLIDIEEYTRLLVSECSSYWLFSSSFLSLSVVFFCAEGILLPVVILQNIRQDGLTEGGLDCGDAAKCGPLKLGRLRFSGIMSRIPGEPR